MNKFLKDWCARPIIATILFQLILRRLFFIGRNLLLESKPTLFLKAGGVAESISKAIPSLQNPYTPSFLYYFSLLSTGLYPYLKESFFSNLPTNYHRTNLYLETYQNSGGGATVCPETVPPGIVSIDWAGATEDSADSIYVVVPGLTGSSKDYYVRSFILHLETNAPKARVAAYNPRSRGGNKLDSPFLYSAGYTQDLRRVIRHIHDNVAAERPIYLIGFSLGGNVVAKLLGEDGVHSFVNRAVVCSPPIDLLSMSNHLANTFMGQCLDAVLVRGCNNLLGNDSMFASVICDARPTSMADLDGKIIAPMMGCTSASDYYRKSSSGLWLNKIQIPLCVVCPQDDPLVNAESVRKDDFESNPFLAGVFPIAGGHSMDCPSSDGTSWFSQVSLEWCRAAVTS